MYSLPNQSRNEWIEDLSRAISYSGKHISLYQLTIEKGTRFFSDYRNKKFSMPNENLSKNMYTDTVEFLENKNIRQYEISNFAMPGYECKHNLGYWKYKSYLGIGAGAHSRLHLENNIVKTVVMEHSPENWLNSVSLNGNAIQSECILDDKEVATEKVIMGLRQFDGINLKEIGDFINKSNMNHCIKAGFLNFEKNKLHITKKGTLVLNSIIESLLT